MEATRIIIRTNIKKKLVELIETYLSSEDREFITLTENIDHLSDLLDTLIEDLVSYVDRDPASGGDYEQVLKASLSFSSVLNYRLSHLLWINSRNREMKVSALKISELNKSSCGIDIHPAAAIGKRFVLDHAHSIVIGETVTIGNDCYMLGGVTLGATGISSNEHGKRHPQIGDHVQIGASVRIFGPVNVGNNVFISPYCVITSNIPQGARISIVNQVQLVREKEKKNIQVNGFFVNDQSAFMVYEGNNLQRVIVVDAQYQAVGAIECSISDYRDSLCRIEFNFVSNELECEKMKSVHLKVLADDSESVLLNPSGLVSLLKQRCLGKDKQYDQQIDEHRTAV